MIANTQIPLVSFIVTTYNLPIEYIKVLQEEKMKKLQERVAAQQTEF